MGARMSARWALGHLHVRYLARIGRMETRDIFNKQYLPRLIDSSLNKALAISGAVILEGPRGCGKTMTATHAAASAIYLDDEATRQLIDVNPLYPFQGERPRLIDEWQLRPEVWNATRRQVDMAPDFGQFILTGSSVPSDDISRHTGAARFLRLTQRTLTWFERGVNPDANVSLAALFDGHTPHEGPTGKDYSTLVDRLCHNGLPRFYKLGSEAGLRQANAYLDEIVHTDLPRLEDIRVAPEQLRHMIRSIARLTASEGHFSKVQADLSNIVPDIQSKTIARYCELLQRIFVLEPQPAWATSVRSRARLRTSPKWHLADTSLAVAALNTSAAKLETDVETTGLLFESQVIHDLRVLSEPLGGRVYHFRDSSGREIDAIIELPDGRWGAVEVKISATRIKDAIESLARATATIQEPPTFRLVLTAMGPTFTATDGTITCPLEALTP